MLYLIILPMIVSMLLVPLIGERLIKSFKIALTGALVSLFLSTYYLFKYFGNQVTESYNWFGVSNFFNLSISGDNLTLLMAVMVSFISLMVLIFSVFYMKKEPQERYYVEMSLFIASMLGLVLSSSLLLFYIFWELVGVSSYLLIGFWYKKESASAAGKKALIMTRIGDMSFLAAIVLLFTSTGTFSIPSILQELPALPNITILLSGALILIAALSKSAQFPFYTWLPDAMEGPTPVSALLHSATMVAAGAYLLVVMYPLLFAAGLNTVIVSIGFITAVLSALLALNHRHTKRILAYSTIESLAFMFIAIGTINTGGAVFYLMVHAVFKSMLFFISGVFAVLIGVQDVYKLKLKRLSSTWLKLPALIGFASISGLPPFMSFFAHTAISANFTTIEGLVFTVISFLTALFSFRAFFLIFNRKGVKLDRKVSTAMPIYILSIISTIGGATLFFFSKVLAGFMYKIDIFTVITTAAAFLGVYVAFEVFYKDKLSTASASFKDVANKLMRVAYDKILFSIGMSFVSAGDAVGKFDNALSKFYDRSADSALFLSSKSRRIENGNVETYIIAILIGIIASLVVASVFVW
ncbi:MAG: hypothetical protein M1433_00375 [Candidatus Parvarchaeota archaeon]|nr:hypothetical protein [Candidatus Parvarchaeota archaeon]